MRLHRVMWRLSNLRLMLRVHDDDDACNTKTIMVVIKCSLPIGQRCVYAYGFECILNVEHALIVC